jgi:hypothetical protein
MTPGDSVTVGATGSNRSIVVVHVDRYGEEEMLLQDKK